jgi:hypothetical protein
MKALENPFSDEFILLHFHPYAISDSQFSLSRTTKSIMDATGFTRAGAQKVIDRFVALDILKEKEQESNYDIKYIYERYFAAFIN